MAKKRTRPAKAETPESNSTEDKRIEREDFDWGVRLTARPFKGMENQSLVICSEIDNYRARRGAEVRITFPAVSRHNALRLLDAHNWTEAMNAIVAQTRLVQAELRTTATSKKKTQKRC